MYKHAISTAILVAMITSSMAYSHNKQLSMVTAALFFDIGYRYVPKAIIEQGNQLSAGDREVIQQSLERGLNFLSMYQNDFDFMPQAVNLCTAYVYSTNPQKALSVDSDMATMMMILKIADTFDHMTAMNLGHEPESEISAMRYLYSNGREFHPDIVNKLSECIHIVPQAASVDLSTGDKGIVLVENPSDFMHPIILRLNDNQIYDLRNPIASSEIQVVDIMKTMDNRIVVDEETRKQFVPDERLIELTEEFRKKLYS